MTRFVLAVFFTLAPFTPVAAQSAAPLTAAATASPAPAGLAAPVAARLSKSGVRVSAAKGPTLDFWWVDGLPVKPGASAPAWEDVEEGALVGVVSLSAAFRDIRGKILKPGIYTLRYGLQPDNGDHLGVSPFRHFLLLSPAAADKDAAAAGHEGTIELSKTSIGGSHPGVWSLDPPAAGQPPLDLHKTTLGHHAVVMEVAVTRDGKPAGALRFGLVLIGTIEA
jgi:hypothetical protein